MSVRQRIEQETSITHFLYLVPNYDLLWFVADKLSECKRAVYFGLLQGFSSADIDAASKENGSPVSVTLTSVLTHGQAVQKTGTLWENIAV